MLKNLLIFYIFKILKDKINVFYSNFETVDAFEEHFMWLKEFKVCIREFIGLPLAPKTNHTYDLIEKVK